MAWSKTTRILTLLGIDSIFFLLELIVGYRVHSLALVADSFHMLNDILSLCVGLWAVKVAAESPSSNKYTYGWQRAETLGALVNGVFLVALCLSIFLDAIQRFFEPQVVSNPQFVLIVGCFGLLSNILGLLLFHEHGHSHGSGEEGHTHNSDHLVAAEAGASEQRTAPVEGHAQAISDEGGNVADVLPQTTIGNWPQSETFRKVASEDGAVSATRHKSMFSGSDEDDATVNATTESGSPVSRRKHSVRRSQRSGSRTFFQSVNELAIHPASFRKDFIASSRLDENSSYNSGDFDYHDDMAGPPEPHTPTESSPLLIPYPSKSNGSAHLSPPTRRKPSTSLRKEDSDALHHGHYHCKPQEPGNSSHGHSHADLNMRGVFLHVMGDALGNIGVITSALIIWLTHFPQRYYVDPAISLVITIIILTSALPLCRAAGRILLQAVPDHISVEEIKSDIEDLPGIISCHHLHVWQLSDVKLIASLHIQVDFDFKGEGSARYMQLARTVRRCLHEYGIHSSTIQPEFCLDEDHALAVANNSKDARMNGQGVESKKSSKKGSNAPSLHSQPDTCLLDCGDACAKGRMCCPTSNGGGGQQDHGGGA